MVEGVVHRPYFDIKVSGTKNRAWSLCACVTHAGESCTVVILVCKPFRIPSRSQRKLLLVPDLRINICTVS